MGQYLDWLSLGPETIPGARVEVGGGSSPYLSIWAESEKGVSKEHWGAVTHRRGLYWAKKNRYALQKVEQSRKTWLGVVRKSTVSTNQTVLSVQPLTLSPAGLMNVTQLLNCHSRGFETNFPLCPSSAWCVPGAGHSYLEMLPAWASLPGPGEGL
jgi:hypothetical protein